MAQTDGTIYWYEPNPRTIIPLDDGFHVSRSLQRVVRQKKFEVCFDTQFERVMRLCAESAPDRGSTWISEELIRVYTELHKQGHAHSVECWQDGELVGGLYGVSINGLFAGESMFHRVRDASKVALVHLVEHLRARRFVVLDTQYTTSHLRRFGAIEIPREAYRRLLTKALQIETCF